MTAPDLKDRMYRHDLLRQIHQLVRPQVYLEVGVQTGASLDLAKDAEVAFGIDPNPLISASGNQEIFPQTSDEFFASPTALQRLADRPIDLAFIDGDHTYDQALRDFFNIQTYGHKNTVVVFDDVLPYRQDVGSRTMVPGDWAGDVWRVDGALMAIQPNLVLVTVDVVPTGVLIAWDLDPGFVGFTDQVRKELNTASIAVPDYVISRTYAISPEAALGLLRERLA